MTKPRKSRPNTQTLTTNHKNHTKKTKPWTQTLKIVPKKQNPKPYQILSKNHQKTKNGAKSLIFFKNNKWFLDKMGHDGLNKMLAGFEDKSGYALCIFSYFDEGMDEPITFRGETHGINL